MGGKGEKFFKQFSPGFFDLIVFDEAHRSIYDRNNLIYQYFDAIKIGLTATPLDRETQSTFELFGEPAAEYSYDDAVRDGVLVTYTAHIIGTKILDEGIQRSDLDKFLKDQLRRQNVDPDDFEASGSQFDRIFMDDKTNEIIINEFMKNSYKSDEGKPAKTIFFCASQHHAQHIKEVFGRLYPKLSSEVQVITSDMNRAEDEVVRFQKQSEPRIALSVGMLDTGVDIPEVCNLLFVRPVYSPIRFWQMLGRGTRNTESCKHKEWLPERNKKNFLIFDFTIGGFSNIIYHGGEIKSSGDIKEDVLTRIFRNRVVLLGEDLNMAERTIITSKIMNTLESLDNSFFLVREKHNILNQLKNTADLEEYIEQLNEDIAPLIITQQGHNSQVSSFILLSEKLFHMILARDRQRVEKVREKIQFMVENVVIKDNLQEVSKNKNNLFKVLKMEFWDDITFEDVNYLVETIAPLMKYYEPEGHKIIDINVIDEIITQEEFVKQVEEDPQLMSFLETNIIAKKIKTGEYITSSELLELEKRLSEFKPEITIENVQRTKNVDFIRFLWDIMGLSREEDPQELIEELFDQYIIENVHYNSRQLDFLMLLKKVFAKRKHVEMKDLGLSPLNDEHPLDLFSYEELEKIVEKCNNIRMC